MTKGETARDTHRNGTWSRDVWPKDPPLQIGFECWLLDIQIVQSLDIFSGGL